MSFHGLKVKRHRDVSLVTGKLIATCAAGLQTVQRLIFSSEKVDFFVFTRWRFTAVIYSDVSEQCVEFLQSCLLPPEIKSLLVLLDCNSGGDAAGDVTSSPSVLSQLY